MKKPKYKNYAELSAAFKSGELSKGYFLMLDKGGTENSLCFADDSLSDEEVDKINDKCGDLFSGDQPIESIFEALGIPAEWC